MVRRGVEMSSAGSGSPMTIKSSWGLLSMRKSWPLVTAGLLAFVGMVWSLGGSTRRSSVDGTRARGEGALGEGVGSSAPRILDISSPMAGVMPRPAEGCPRTDRRGFFTGLVYGVEGYMNLTDVRVETLSSRPIFGDKPRLLEGKACDPDEPDPLGALCIWGLVAAPHFNPTLLPIPETSPLRKVGKYVGLARPPSPKLPKLLGVPILEKWRNGDGMIRENEYLGKTLGEPPAVMIYGDDLRVKAVTKLYDKVHPGHQSDARVLLFNDEWWIHFRADCLRRGPSEASPPQTVDCDLSNGWVGEHRKQRAVMMKMEPEVWGMQGKLGLVARTDPDTLIPLVGSLAGKNQAFFQHGSGPSARRFVLAWLNPTAVHEINGTSINPDPIQGSDETQKSALPLEAVHLNGGQLWYIPETDEYLGLAHHIYRRSDGLRLYNIHLFFTLGGQPPFALQRISPEFCFESTTKPGDCEKRQFAMGMVIEERPGKGKIIMIPYGVNNYEAKMYSMTQAEALSMLRPATSL